MPKKKEKKQKESEETGEAKVVDLRALSVWQIIQFSISLFESLAWQKMGLVVNPQTQEIEKDLDQARAAIDSFESLLTHLGKNIAPDEKKILEARLADLKLNYSKQA
jgi:hypothetical protein